jgi:predicted nucleotide-binding protein (sugar kinase/HSP70/actin superfamily)
MKLTVPHLGHMDIFLRAMSRRIGPEFIFPPKTSLRTLHLGTKYSPESTCLPFKFILGNFIEALEKGADTIAMISDHGPCRLGMYDVVMQQILKDLGFQFDWITMDDTHLWSDYLIRFNRERKKRGVSFWESLQAIRFSWRKVRLCESIERMAHKIRPLEVKRGETTRAQTDCFKFIDEASNFRDLRLARQQCLERFNRIEKDDSRNPLKVLITGEGYMVINPHANQEIERRLGEMGVEVTRTVWFTSQIAFALHLDFLNPRSKRSAIKASRPYLKHNLGGECNASIGYPILYKKDGYEGAIQLLPFVCMLEAVAKNILVRVSQEHNIPVLTFSLNENLAETMITTRLSAFVDLLQKRRERSKFISSPLAGEDSPC